MIEAIKSGPDTHQLVKNSDDTYKLDSTEFELGKGKNITTPDGRKIKNIFTIEGNKLIEQQVGEKTITVIREFTDDQIISTASVGNVTSTTWFKLVV